MRKQEKIQGKKINFYSEKNKFSGRRLTGQSESSVTDSHVIIYFLYSMSDAYY